ncbi:Degreening-related dee76 protein [Coccomyxa subellipsoidea C-169]|uniref:Degreening-related dee76 protein n=1 Tax=Coccomyxa subellipsoidea (strain C-169) TaxID=574566 RepID=I0Z2E1_COCSC|nr:Degreening-related dee76 protein [Coccomyxa subellipsoidea C-169]EIE24810.1 Degreening-related dee76 protein [Coccomyxa subellipsoidea C-169]|eukprot:XP_005649354.1 Degreening-related dee76 protein [Coccomyxa subellipsoidea C-169]
MANILKKVLHNTSSKSPQDMVLRAAQTTEKLTDTATERQQEELARYLSQMKAAMYGDGEIEPSKETAVLLCWEACKVGLPLVLAQKLSLLDFETRKDAAQVCGCIFRMDSNADGPGVRFVHEHPHILEILFQGYDNPSIALNCGSMLRDCVRDESLARMVLEGPLFQEYFKKVEVSNFEVASDAFQTFKDLLTRHEPLVASYLQGHYQEFFGAYVNLLQSSNYVTRRQSLKLLGELLLNRANVKVMMRYVSDVNNLKLMMILLKDNSRSIQFEAFHVFKVFVANPNKTKEIVEVLSTNKEKLLKYLGDFHTDKEDEQFKEEKAVIIKEISMLQSQQDLDQEAGDEPM